MPKWWCTFERYVTPKPQRTICQGLILSEPTSWIVVPTDCPRCPHRCPLHCCTPRRAKRRRRATAHWRKGAIEQYSAAHCKPSATSSSLRQNGGGDEMQAKVVCSCTLHRNVVSRTCCVTLLLCYSVTLLWTKCRRTLLAGPAVLRLLITGSCSWWTRQNWSPLLAWCQQTLLV